MNLLLVLATLELYSLKCINCDKYLKTWGYLYCTYITSVMQRVGKNSTMMQTLVSAKNSDWQWYFVVP